MWCTTLEWPGSFNIWQLVSPKQGISLPNSVEQPTTTTLEPPPLFRSRRMKKKETFRMKECHCPGDDGIFVAWDIIVLCQLCFVALAWDSEGLSCHGKGLLFCLRADQTRINGVILVLYNYSVASSGSIYSGTTVLRLSLDFMIVRRLL